MEKAVCYKIDSLMKKGKTMYVNFQKKRETGKELTEQEAWNSMAEFQRLLMQFKDHIHIFGILCS